MSKTLVTLLLDRTGSMESVRDDTIGAFNTYLDTLKQDGDSLYFTLIQFDSMSVDKVHVNEPVKEIPRLTRETYVPRASTPLIDAAYKTIKAVEKSVNGSPQTKIVICIQTDGQENASTEYTNPYNGALPARDASELRDTLFRTLSDLRAGRITAQEAKAVADAVTKALFGHPATHRLVNASTTL